MKRKAKILKTNKQLLANISNTVQYTVTYPTLVWMSANPILSDKSDINSKRNDTGLQLGTYQFLRRQTFQQNVLF